VLEDTVRATTFPKALPVTVKLPVITALPVKGKLTAPEAFNANEAVKALDAKDALVANEADTALDDQLEVPNRDPVNDVAAKDPVKPYEPESCFEFIQRLPLLTRRSPNELDTILTL